MTDLAARLQKVIEERLAVAHAASAGPWETPGPDTIAEWSIYSTPRGWMVASACVNSYPDSPSPLLRGGITGDEANHNAAHIALNNPADAILECEFALALLDEMAHWRHVLTDDYLHTCSVATEERGGKCDCGVDARRTRLLALMAKRYGLEVDGG